MMEIHFHTLSIQCKESKEILDLNYQVLFFHGRVGSGKSSIARLINFCLGGNLERTTAIKQEVTSVSLELSVGSYKALFERDAANDTYIMATCVDAENKSFSVNVPVAKSSEPVWDDKVYNISDLIFYLLDIEVLRIPANKNREDAGLVRLSMKNFMWYCYLDQSKLDNSFFRHEDPTKTRNSKEVLKYIVQYSTQKLIELQERLQQYRQQRFSDIATSKGLREFLKKFGFSTETEIEHQVTDTKKKLDAALQEKNKMEAGYSKDTHSSDLLRNQIRRLIDDISALETGIQDIENRIVQQETLRAELVSSKFKLAKSDSIATVFQGVEFENCPDCGTSLRSKVVDAEHCKLCGSEVGKTIPEQQENAEVVQMDLNERIAELETSIDLHKKQYQKTKKQLSAKNVKRRELDEQLFNELKVYESVFLSNIRRVDQRVATLQERMKGLNRLKLMPREIAKLEENASDLVKNEGLVKEQIALERQNLGRGEALIEELQETFLKTLLDVGVPGVGNTDAVFINRNTWEVQILPKGEEYLEWNFYNAGSGGKKTLFNSCFLLSLHIVAARHDLPIPSFIIIDTPMKNIDKEVNQDIFKSFYTYLYDLASSILNRTQFIIIDNNFIAPPPDLKLSFFDRYMTDDDPDNPPLLRHYKGA